MATTSCEHDGGLNARSGPAVPRCQWRRGSFGRSMRVPRAAPTLAPRRLRRLARCPCCRSSATAPRGRAPLRTAAAIACCVPSVGHQAHCPLDTYADHGSPRRCPKWCPSRQGATVVAGPVTSLTGSVPTVKRRSVSPCRDASAKAGPGHRSTPCCPLSSNRSRQRRHTPDRSHSVASGPGWRRLTEAAVLMVVAEDAPWS